MSNHNQKPIEVGVEKLVRISEENKQILIKLTHEFEKTQFSQPNIGDQMEKNKLTCSEGCPCKQPKIGITQESVDLMTTAERSPKASMKNVRVGYEQLALVLELALEQAQNGKGNARHEVGNAPFSEQPICELARLYGVGYNFGQAAKKAHETNQLSSQKAKTAELLGAIVYLAAAVIVIGESD